jgi:tellurite resistance protein
MSTESSSLKFLPVPLFATVMGLTGFAIVAMKLAHLFHFSHWWGRALLYAVSVWFVFLCILYLLKLMRYPEEVKAEWVHPVRMNFFPAITICLLLFSIAFLTLHPAISRLAWMIGAPMHLALLLRTLKVWFHKEFEIHAFNPSWFIPVVGPILIPIAGVHWAHLEINWFFFAIGLIYWLVLLSIFMNRVIFHHPIPAKLVPTLFILIAPASVGFISYMRLTDSLDGFARVLFYFGVFTALMLVTMADRFRRIPFFISWWAYTFPLDALTLSTILMAETTKLVVFRTLALGFSLMTFLVIVWVSLKTLSAMKAGTICVPE